MQRKLLALKERSQLPIGNARPNRNHSVLCADDQHLLHRLQRQEFVVAIRYGIEAMPRAEYLELLSRLYKRSDLICRRRLSQAIRAVCQITRPVRKPFVRRIRRERLKHPASRARRQQIEE